MISYLQISQMRKPTSMEGKSQISDCFWWGEKRICWEGTRVGDGGGPLGCCKCPANEVQVTRADTLVKTH